MFMQQGGVVPSQTRLPPAQMMDPQMMDPSMMDPSMMDPSMMDPSMLPPGATQQVVGNLMEQEGAALTDGIMSQVDSAQDYEELMNAIRGNELPIGDRRRELAELVGAPDAEQTPDSVLTLVQPTLSLVDAQGGLDSLMQEQANIAMEDGTGAPTPMAGGLGSMLMAGQPEEPVQMAYGGLVRKMANGTTGNSITRGQPNLILTEALGGLNEQAFMDSYDRLLPTFIKAAGTPDKSLQKAQAYASLAGAGLSLAQGSRQPGATFLGDLAGAFQPVPGELTAIASQGSEQEAAARMQAAGLAGQMDLERLKLRGVNSGKSVQVGGPQVDPTSGEVYVITLAPDGTLSRQRVMDDSGNVQIALTPAQESELEQEQAAAIRRVENKDDLESKIYADVQSAQNFAADFEEVLYNVKEAQKAGLSTGTGFLNKYLPKLNEYSSMIDSLEGRLGLGVVGSVTFGALSKGELDLAKSINFNSDLTGEALVKDIENRLIAKQKLAGLLRDAYGRLRAADSVKEFRDGEIKIMKLRDEVLNSWDEHEEALKEANPEQFGSITKSYWRKELSSDQREAILRRLLKNEGFNEAFVNN
jgi:hypothetical protein